MDQAHLNSSEREAPFDISAVMRGDAFPHATGRIELRETHISWVLLTGEYAYKIKKPVRYDFIDAASLEQRRCYCEEELRLSRRLAPDIYLSVVPITRVSGRLVVGGEGTAIEYAVRMRQFSASQELPALLASAEVSAGEVAALGASLARFHQAAPVAPPARAPERTERMFEAVLGNLAQLLTHIDSIDPALGLSGVIDWTHDNARLLEPVFQRRERAGFVREGHGDLHASNIVRLQGKLVPFDCIEFDPQLRWIDVMSDIAFLVMDLVSHQRADLAFVLLSSYLEVTGDYDGLEVLPFYAVYRALVRAKVDALAAEQIPARAPEFRHRLQQRIRAARHWTNWRRPILVLMHGASGSGKSWLSAQLAPELRAVRIRSDLERKRLAGIEPSQSAASGVRKDIYSSEFSHRTYGHLADCAERSLRSGIDTIVDAAFLEATDRALFRNLASRLNVSCFIVSCQADPIALAARVLERSQRRTDPSDANLSVLDAQLRGMHGFAADEQHSVIPIDTSEPDAVRRVATAIASRRSV
jgi:aminoglycoside phosphotransferase family enzyme/predicted kinase